MKSFFIPTLLILSFGQCAASAQDADLKQAIAKLSEHTIRLEEQNKATQNQLSMLERQMEKRFEAVDKQIAMLRDNMDKRFEAIDKRFSMMQEYMDKRFEAVDKRLDLMLWVFGIIGSLLTVGVGYLIYAVRSLAVLEEQLKHKVDTERIVELEKTVEAIVEQLEKEGKKIIVDR